MGIPFGSATAPRILFALCQPGASAETVSRLIGQEPGLTARVLRVANSPCYGMA
ncbi:MAG: HDOD domain-containing protein [Gammaproteobacteria bacterium]|nr:HDOD domain-containing protein [Gammaproteobacteria bacterium]